MFFFDIQKYEQTVGVKKEKKKHTGTINQSLQPMLRNCSVGRQSYNIGGHECSKTKEALASKGTTMSRKIKHLESQCSGRLYWYYAAAAATAMAIKFSVG